MTALNVLELTLETSAGVQGVSHHAWINRASLKPIFLLNLSLVITLTKPYVIS